MKKFHIGLVGAGAIAREHAISLTRMPHVGSLSVFDSNASQAAALAERYAVRVAPTLKSLVRECDLVWICTPPFARRAAILEACRQQKAVFCEKPLGISLADCRFYEQAVRRAKIPFFMGQSGRCAAFTRKMKALVDEGAIGRPVKIWATRLGWLDPAKTPAWRLNDRLGGGTVIELGVHEIDFMRWICGDFRRVSAVASSRTLVPGKFQDTLAAVGVMDRGVLAQLDIGWASPRYLWQRGVEGDEGSLFFDDARVTEVALLRPGRPTKLFKVETWRNEETLENQALRDQAKAVLNALAGKGQAPAILCDGAAAVAVALAMKRAAAAGSTVTVS